ncbi:MAG: hypothetical protein R3E50_12210 [Halioglobus sp.]
MAYDFGMGDSGVREDYPDEVRLRELMDHARETGLFDNDHKPSIIAFLWRLVSASWPWSSVTDNSRAW